MVETTLEPFRPSFMSVMTSFDLLSTALPAAFFTLMLTLLVSGNMVDSPTWFSHFTYLSTGCSDVMVHSYSRKLDSVTLYGDDKSIIPPSVNPASGGNLPLDLKRGNLCTNLRQLHVILDAAGNSSRSKKNQCYVMQLFHITIQPGRKQMRTRPDTAPCPCLR